MVKEVYFEKLCNSGEKSGGEPLSRKKTSPEEIVDVFFKIWGNCLNFKLKVMAKGYVHFSAILKYYFSRFIKFCFEIGIQP